MADSDNNKGTLYVVATPIGNLNDFSPRAVECLKSVDLIAAEDTRHSRKLLDAWGINTALVALHEHNEQSASGRLLEKLQSGLNVALISDAGTPLISDPGQKLIPRLVEAGISVSPIPGACAITTALSAAGLPTQPYWFEGFLAAKGGDRKRRLETLNSLQATLVFYEAPHRIHASLEAMAEVLGPQRQACVARELTKRFEEFRRGTLAELSEHFADRDKCRGEMVVLVEGMQESSPQQQIDSDLLLGKLLQALPVKAASKLASELTGENKNSLYQRALEMKDATKKPTE
jgi:16S rRNA (cytidine1402-2'-O)-methyltransferase